MEETNKIQINVENYNGKDPIRVVFREGVAAKVLDEKAPESINVSGVLSTPLDWLEKRVDTIEQHEAHILVSRDNLSITLVVDERNYYKKATIKGTAQLSEVFTALGINDGAKGWTPAKLGQFLRLNRALFEDKEACMKLVSQLKNFTAKAKSEIEKQHDPSGSRAEVYRQTVESNLPKSFAIRVPLFKGKAKTTIDVEFDHYLTDGEVFLQLVSPGARELMDEWRDQSIDEVLTAIREIAPDIAIMEV